MLPNATSSLSFIKNNRLAFLTTCIDCGHRLHLSWSCQNCNCYTDSKQAAYKKGLEKTHLWLKHLNKTVTLREIANHHLSYLIWLADADTVYRRSYDTKQWCTQCQKSRKHIQLFPLYTNQTIPPICLFCNRTAKYKLIPSPPIFENPTLGPPVAHLLDILPTPLTAGLKPRRKRK